MVDRRTVLKLSAVAAVTPSAVAAQSKMIFGGWRNIQSAKDYFRRRKVWAASQVDQAIRDTGKNKVVRLWKVWEEVAGKAFEPHKQLLGDCVSQAMALGLEVDSAIEVQRSESYHWTGKISTEAIYIASRIEVAGGALGFMDGSTGAWAVQAAEKYGTLQRKDYGEDFNVEKYNPEVVKRYAYSMFYTPGEGVPNRLEPEMAKLQLKRGVLIDQGFDQAADFVANGYPVFLAGRTGFRSQTDREGVILPSRAPWNHATLLWGIDTKSTRQVGCIANSWGDNWLKELAKYKYGTPSGCFWADRKDIEQLLSEGDSYALVGYTGPKRRDLDYTLMD